jgi:uncharacterized protein DUF6855
MAAGTKADPWTLTTPPGTSEYTMYKDDEADPPALVCQVGTTTLKYHLSAIDDLAAWLRTQRDWVPLGAADEQKPEQQKALSKHGGALTTIRWAVGTACARVIAAASGCTCRRCSRHSVSPN